MAILLAILSLSSCIRASNPAFSLSYTSLSCLSAPSLLVCASLISSAAPYTACSISPSYLLCMTSTLTSCSCYTLATFISRVRTLSSS